MRLLAFALVLSAATPALAGGRTFSLSTLVKNGSTALKPGESKITVRADRSTKVSQSFGTNGVLVPVPSHLNSTGTNRLFTAGAGSFFVSPQLAQFQIQ